MKKISVIIGFFICFFVITFPTYAADKVELCDPSSQFGTLCALSTGDFGPVLGQLLNFIFVIAITAALFYLVWGGFKWLTSGGDKGAVGSAREHIVAAIVGVFVILLSYFILNIVLMFFTGKNVSELEIPTLGSPAPAPAPTCKKLGKYCTKTSDCCNTAVNKCLIGAGGGGICVKR